MNPILILSGTKLAELIKKRKITSMDTVEAHIEQMLRVQPKLNSVVKDRFNEARKEASLADKKIKSSKGKNLPPFHGVPCTIKESFSVEGMPNSSGLMARKDVIGTEDATVVSRIKKAGAIPLAVTNTPELCLWIETYNRLYGRTNNPYNRRRTAGGSSGGEGSIIGAGGSPFGIGSDFAGSIRLPAFFNGVFGHKPTGGMVPGTGHHPMVDRPATRYVTHGPLARRAEDLMPILKIIAGPDGIDDMCIKFKLGNPAKVIKEKPTLIYVEGNGSNRVSKDLRKQQRMCADALEKKGVKIKESSFKNLKKSFFIWASIVSAAQSTPVSLLLGNGKRKINVPLELIKWAFRLSDHSYTNINLAYLDKLDKIFPKMTSRLISLGEELRHELSESMGPNGCMLYPSYTVTAPYHHVPLLKLFHFAYTAIFNALEFPATQVPLGLSGKGLPLGIQVVSIPGNDHVTIAMAIELEKALGGWIPPWDADK